MEPVEGDRFRGLLEEVGDGCRVEAGWVLSEAAAPRFFEHTGAHRRRPRQVVTPKVHNPNMSVLSGAVKKALGWAGSPVSSRRSARRALSVVAIVALVSPVAFNEGVQQYLQSEACANMVGPVRLYFNSLFTTPAVARDLPQRERYVVVRTNGWCSLKAVAG